MSYIYCWWMHWLDVNYWFIFSYERSEAFKFQLGIGQVIKGWDQGLTDMCIGEKRRLTIPPHLGYGDSGAGNNYIYYCIMFGLILAHVASRSLIILLYE